MGIVIEKASAADAAALLDYLKQVGGETDNLTFGPEGLSFTTEQEVEYLTQLENSTDGVMYVAKEDGKIIGDASLNRLPRRMNHRGELGITVVKSHWRRGVGSCLLEKIIDFAKENGMEYIDLTVRGDNFAAISLYRKFGFEKIGEHPAFKKIRGEYIRLRADVFFFLWPQGMAEPAVVRLLPRSGKQQ